MVAIATIRVAMHMGVWHRCHNTILLTLLALLISGLICSLLIVIDVSVRVAMRVIPVVCFMKIWVW